MEKGKSSNGAEPSLVREQVCAGLKGERVNFLSTDHVKILAMRRKLPQFMLYF
jgi:hypothetical protein